MSIAEIFETGERKQDRSHFRNMVMIAKADGVISPEEEAILDRIGTAIGLNPDQISLIKAKPQNYPINPPVSRIERFEQIVNLVQMVVADGEITDSEMNVLEKIAVGIGYDSLEEVDVESIVALIGRGADTDTIIDELL